MSCLPAYLKKYRSSDDPVPENLAPLRSETDSSSGLSFEQQQETSPTPVQTRASIRQDPDGGYLVPSRAKTVWRVTLELLARDYILTEVNERWGVMTTDWDRFSLGQNHYRNRLTLTLSAARFGYTRLRILNKVEVLRVSSDLPSSSPQWYAALPAVHLVEVKRLLQNLSVRLSLPLEASLMPMARGKKPAVTGPKQPG